MNAGVPCALGCGVGNCCLREIYLTVNETVQITGLFLDWISALDGNPANFITFPQPWKGQPALLRQGAAACSGQGDHGFAASQVGMPSLATDVGLSSRSDLP